jgi:hypothetical protein
VQQAAVVNVDPVALYKQLSQEVGQEDDTDKQIRLMEEAADAKAAREDNKGNGQAS